jgi:signal transduction histidine kinase
VSSRRRTHSARDLRRARTRITLLTLGSLLALLAVTGLTVVRLYERDLVEAIDGRLQADAERADLVVAERVIIPPKPITYGVLVQFIDGQGRLLFASESLAGEPALWHPDRPGGPQTVETAGRGTVRVLPRSFSSGWVLLAEPMRPVDDATSTLRTTLLATALPLAVVLGFFVWIAVGRALRPVRDAREREEQLVADVSHELRSPMAGMRVVLETEPCDRDGVELTRRQALAALGRLEDITDQLLTLGTRDQPQASGPPGPVDIDEIVHDCARALAVRTTLTIDTTRVVAGQVLGDRNSLVSLVENLLTNALRHARGQVRIAVTEEQGTVELVVEDDGPGVPPDERARVFERFTRLDEARSRDQGGAGLGLAIARSVVLAHDGTIELRDSGLGGARFVVRLPASTTPTVEPSARPAIRHEVV